jgi:hypothetical protein
VAADRRAADPVAERCPSAPRFKPPVREVAQEHAPHAGTAETRCSARGLSLCTPRRCSAIGSVSLPWRASTRRRRCSRPHRRCGRSGRRRRSRPAPGARRPSTRSPSSPARSAGTAEHARLRGPQPRLPAGATGDQVRRPAATRTPRTAPLARAGLHPSAARPTHDACRSDSQSGVQQPSRHHSMYPSARRATGTEPGGTRPAAIIWRVRARSVRRSERFTGAPPQPHGGGQRSQRRGQGRSPRR